MRYMDNGHNMVVPLLKKERLFKLQLLAFRDDHSNILNSKIIV